MRGPDGGPGSLCGVGVDVPAVLLLLLLGEEDIAVLCCAGNDDDSEWLLPCRRMQEICIGLILQSKLVKLTENKQLIVLMC